jgi:hypothetical protein
MSGGLAAKLAKTYTASATDKMDLLKDYGFSQKSVIPTRGNSVANALYSKSELANELQHRVKALGPQRGGVIMLDEDGKPLKNHRYYSHELKKWVTTDGDGRVIMGNKAIVDEAYQLYIEREQMIDDIAEKCVCNDEICAYILGYGSVAELSACLAGTKSFEVDGKPLTDKLLVEIDAMPSNMRRYAHGQKERLLAVQKLRLLVGERLNFVNLIDYGDKVSDRHNENVQEPTDIKFGVDGSVGKP